MRSRPWLWLLASLFALYIPANVEGFDLQGILTGYSVTSWAEHDGRAIGPIRAIVQDGVGYLWLGTADGLLRFDGVRFVTSSSLGIYGLPSSPVRALLIAHHDEAMWIGFGEAGGIRTLRNGRLADGTATLPSVSVSSLAEDSTGAIWAATDHGLFRYFARRWDRYSIGERSSTPTILTVRIDHRGVLLVGTSVGLFEQVSPGHFQQLGISQTAIRDVAQDANGTLWVTDPAEGFHPALSRAAPNGHDGVGLRIMQDHRGNLWVGTRGQGLWRVRPQHGDAPRPAIELATVDTGLVGNGVWDVLEDREGNIWAATQQGLSRLTPHSVRQLVDLGLVQSVELGNDGDVWVGTARELIRLDRDTLQTRPVPLNGQSQVRALYSTAEGALWFGAHEGLGVMTGRHVSQPKLGDVVPLGDIRSIVGDGHRGIWFVTAVGDLFQFDGAVQSRFRLPAEEKAAFVYRSPRGYIWTALQGGSIGRIELDGRFRRFGSNEGLPDGTHATINAVIEDAHGVAWIGGTGGLTRFVDGHFLTFDRTSGLPGQRITALALDQSNYLWMGIDGGVIRVDPDEFSRLSKNRSYKIHYDRFEQSDGLAGVMLATDNEGVARTADGRLWFVTGRGLTIIDPEGIDWPKQEREPAVRIEGVVLDENHLQVSTDGSIPARTTRLRIDYTALQLTAPTRVRFRYKLDGFDSTWIDAGTRRQAYYMNLEPRRYRFLVQASTSDGRWVDNPAVWTFAIRPTFYQTGSFKILCVGVFVMALWCVWQLHLRRIRQEFSIVLAERARLSREIHDTVLQNLAGVAIQCVGIANGLDTGSPARRQLDEVRESVEEHLRDVRQAVWNLRAPILERLALPDALREVAERITEGTGIRVDLAVSGRPCRCAAEVENEVLRIGQEAVTNAVRHSGASRIDIRVSFNRRTLIMNVSDNGSGVTSEHIEELTDGHFGLIGMRERANQLGGALKIVTPPVGGTRIELVVPNALQLASS